MVGEYTHPTWLLLLRARPALGQGVIVGGDIVLEFQIDRVLAEGTHGLALGILADFVLQCLLGRLQGGGEPVEAIDVVFEISLKLRRALGEDGLHLGRIELPGQFRIDLL